MEWKVVTMMIWMGYLLVGSWYPEEGGSTAVSDFRRSACDSGSSFPGMGKRQYGSTASRTFACIAVEGDPGDR